MTAKELTREAFVAWINKRRSMQLTDSADPIYPAMFDYADGVYYCPCCSAKLKLYQIHDQPELILEERGFGTDSRYDDSSDS